ncbi:hypothetical protein LTS02_012039 [Friedmanniomyces endolithicus]|nr:hypothetical protein LTR59_015413 [Friedmanniomyces endolithicus]KAK0773175.1 hypothetical protein LTR38_016660 [Friedmanniomyces endolithicus]KAK0834057.1 hypothetical protein LTR03_014634 [Friedmanniomyces endolithicus]KAK0853254.1 hypothetical protein LTS02_012039 [Friedmanniomyces endolithicus]
MSASAIFDLNYTDAAFVAESVGQSGRRAWRKNAMATYETHVQEVLERLCVLIHISSGQPVREPELFSIM